MSAILSADDLNDFISPGVACIKPVETLPKEENSNPYEVTTEDKIEAQNPAPASISLTDCLACSGCVTSAEAVLVSLQSASEVLNALETYHPLNIEQLALSNGTNGHCGTSHDQKIFVASVSPQVRASIAATYGISERRAGNLITQLLSGSQGVQKNGALGNKFTWVFDTNKFREACLVLGADEVAASLKDKSKSRPILTSACPGWICYAEKTHPHILPHLSALKSPQALAGTLVKSVLSKALNIHPSQIWHLAIMPCFDKKLEASREELTDKWWSDGQLTTETTSSVDRAVRDVDCVITSRELLTLAERLDVKLSALPQTPLPQSERTSFPDATLSRFLFSRPSSSAQTSDAGTSGGYLNHILHTYQSLNPGSTINTIRGRNADVIEYTLTSPSLPNTPILKCARYYGFRNIQNLVRKLKPSRVSKLPGATARRLPGRANQEGGISDYTYVEVMACPGGCTNGGGQIKIEDVASIIPITRGEEIESSKLNTPQSQKEWLRRIDEAYFSADSQSSDDDDREREHESDEFNNEKSKSRTNGHVNGYTNGDVEMTDSPANSLVINGINTAQIHEILEYWSNLVNVPLEKLAYTTFRKVESDVGKKKNMGDSERIAAIAGMSGGGW